MEPLTLTLIVIFAIISLIPFFSRKTGFPVVVAELIAGIILGKSFLNLVPTEEPIIKFLSSFGLTYLMFLAGLEVSFGKLSFSVLRTIPISISSLLLPFTTGMYLSKIIQANPLFLGSVFSTTSLSLTLPLSKEISYEKNRWKDFLLVSVILVDIISMFVLAFSLTLIKGPIEVSFFYSILAALSLFLIPFMASKRKLGEKIESWISKNSHFETGVRLSFALILILAAVSEKLGFHSMIGAFIAGLIVSEISEKIIFLKRKLEGIGYGLFIPLFFIFTGSKVNLTLLFSNMRNISILLLIICFGIFSKVIGVTLASWLNGLDVKESLSLGFLHSARLSLIIAAAEIGYEMGLLNDNIFSMLILLALTSALISPLVGKKILLM